MVEHILFFVLLTVAVGVTIATKKLTVIAALTGGAIASVLYMNTGYYGVALLGAFFLLGTMATSWKQSIKQKQKLAEDNKGQRTTGQVLANAGVAAIAAGCIFFLPQYASILYVLITASFSSATADTLSSELGNVYGSKYYNILTLQKDTRGLNGVISIEGTVIGVAGSAIIACIYSIAYGWTANFLIIVLAGTIGNLSDSILGASVERKGLIGNNAVNFLNTAIGAMVAWVSVFIND